MDPLDEVSTAWDREYRSGRYLGEPPLPFVRDIVSVAKREGLLGGAGLYIGCGNGRNYLPLVNAGLDLTGVDVSLAAIQELAERADRLVHGDLSTLPAETTFGTVVGIQVFQHGSRLFCHEHIRAVQRRVGTGGVLALRVNAVGTDIEFQHDVVEPHNGSGFTIRYLEGPKSGLLVHFFDFDELENLFLDGFNGPSHPTRLNNAAAAPVVPVGRHLAPAGVGLFVHIDLRDGRSRPAASRGAACAGRVDVRRPRPTEQSSRATSGDAQRAEEGMGMHRYCDGR